MSNARNLDDWLQWQESLHVKEIDLGLDRISRVLDRMAVARPARLVITIAGTNGKGSSVAMLASILARSGLRVSAYTSPHLLQYNERLRIDGTTVSDRNWCNAFEAVEQARGDVALTYYEFGTLAALRIMAASHCDVALLEVGLGGRLDAVNVIDADCALITQIGIDHVDYLGPDRDSIGREKAGIFRPGAIAICADPNPPSVIAEVAAEVGARYLARGSDFGWSIAGQGWNWWGPAKTRLGLPLPGLDGEWQLDNAAGCLMVLEALQLIRPSDDEWVAAGLTRVTLPGRLQVIGKQPEILLDVAHNSDAMSCLYRWLLGNPIPGKTHFVFAALADKDIAAMATIMAALVDCWYLAPLSVSRGLSVEQLGERMPFAQDTVKMVKCESVGSALKLARHEAMREDRIVVCGSFYTVSEALSAVS